MLVGPTPIQFNELPLMDLWNKDYIGDSLEGNLDFSMPDFFRDYSAEHPEFDWYA